VCAITRISVVPFELSCLSFGVQVLSPTQLAVCILDVNVSSLLHQEGRLSTRIVLYPIDTSLLTYTIAVGMNSHTGSLAQSGKPPSSSEPTREEASKRPYQQAPEMSLEEEVLDLQALKPRKV